MSASRYVRVGAVLGALAVVLMPVSAQAGTGCVAVTGFYEERPVVGPTCDSPVDLCITATYQGGVMGQAEGRATSLVPTADTPTTSVLLFTSDSTITGRAAGRAGSLIIKNAGAFATAGTGSVVDVQTIIGGTGDLASATGALRAEGTFSFPDGGRSSYTGTICLP